MPLKKMTIGQLAKAAGCKPETIRYYEQAGLLGQPERTASGYRLYDDAHLRRLSFIRKGRDMGFSLADLAKMLQLAENPQASCAEVTRLTCQHLAAIEHRIEELYTMSRRLSGLVSACANGDIAGCRIMEALLDWGVTEHAA